MEDESIPNGFELQPGAQGEFTILYRRTGMGCLTIFLAVWVAGWTFGCVVMFWGYIGGGGDAPDLWFVLIFCAIDILMIGVLAIHLFCSKSFHLDRDCLTIETRVLSFANTKTVPRDVIERLHQVKDGGEGDDSFPSWGLTLEGAHTVTLITRQPYEKSHWLGGVLAEWAEVEFKDVPKE